MPAKTIWVDQTDLLNWVGTLTGIQRTVFNLGTHLREREDVKFFYYDLGEKVFKECQPVVSPGDNPMSLNRIDDAVHVVSLSQKLSGRIKSYLPPTVKTLLKKLIRTKKVNNVTVEVTPPLFGRGDEVIILGGNWGDDHKGFVSALREAQVSQGVKIVHMVYDLIPLKYPNFFLPGSTDSFTDYLKQLVQFADKLICISKSTKKDLAEYIKREGFEHKPVLSVLRLGEDLPSSLKPAARSSTVQKLNRDFILCVGTIEARKNHMLLYLLVKEAKLRSVYLPQIVIAGKRGWMTADIQHMIDTDPDTSKDLFIVDSPADNELTWLYQNCLFTIYPSMYEGWGLPLAESANYGKVCLSSSTSSMPEVLGVLGEYFSPFNTEECLRKITELLNDKELLITKEKALRERKRFTWKDSYLELLKLLNAS